MNNTIEISVLMSVYKEPCNWLKESIDSILSQTFPNFEFIIINDNPDSDVNNQILNEYSLKDKRVVVYSNEKNLGLTQSLNIGLRLAKGNYVARMDADDIAIINRLQVQFEYLTANKNVSLVGSWTKTFGIEKEAYKYPCNFDFLKASLFFGNRISHSSVMFRKEDFRKHDLFYDPLYVKAQDYELWCRASMIVNLGNINDFLMLNRTHSEQISNAGLNSQNNYANEIKLKALNNLGLILSENDKEIFSYFLSGKKVKSVKYLSLIKLIKTLIVANYKKNIYNKKYFNSILLYRFLNLYFKK